MTLPDDLRTGHKLIDAQHLALLSEVERLRRGGVADLDLLRSHFSTHFGEEEQLASDLDYPDLDAHHRAHLELFDAFVQVRARWLLDPTQNSHDRLVGQLFWYVREHVLAEDVRLAAWVQQYRGRRS